MKQLFTMIMALVGLGICVEDAQSQNWQSLYPVLEQVDTTERDSFNFHLSALLDDLEFGEIQLDEVLDSLVALGADEPNLMLMVDSLVNEWSAGQDTLANMLGNSDLNSTDSTEVIDQYGAVNDVWNGNLDSLNNLLDQYDGQIDFNNDAVDEGQDRYDRSTAGLRKHSLHNLRRRLGRAFDATEPKGIGSLGELLDTAFSSLFRLELAYGREGGETKFYHENYEPSASVIRVGSVPRFDRTWEARWHVEASFMKIKENQHQEDLSINDGRNPLRYGGNFSFMFNPGLGRLRAGGRFRLYTSLGMDVQTYAPAHVDPNNRVTFDNVGKTTGYGPEIGSGFIVNSGLITFYTYATIAYGNVSKSPDYEFNARALHAGLHIGDAVNIRYDRGKTSWAPGDYKSVTYSRFTLGILLADLFR